MSRPRKQAVVVIHGIGEQRPMETLRGFVSGVLPDASVRSKPDTFSQSYELRRLSTAPQDGHQTDFLELYWASAVEGTTIRHILQWAMRLLLKPWTLPRYLWPLWVVIWLTLAGTALGLWFAWSRWNTTSSFLQTLVPLVGPLLLAIPQGFLIAYVGDAARYLSPTPSNIAVRKSIRDAGIDLLDRLHRPGAYDRIIVVGHSLGSVIAYDILTHYWARVHTTFHNPARSSQRCLLQFEDLLCRDDESAAPDTVYRQHQRRVWTELRRHGHGWKVTDLITMGSPLAHAEVLLAAGKRDLDQRFRDREFPANPPQLDWDGSLSFRVPEPVRNTRGQLVTPRAPHHAAPFCCTRWTNLFFPAYGGLFGDVIGGPMTGFGPGVRDVPLREGPPWRLTLWSHVRYWRRSRKAWESGSTAPVRRLAEALDLGWRQDRSPPAVATK